MSLLICLAGPQWPCQLPPQRVWPHFIHWHALSGCQCEAGAGIFALGDKVMTTQTRSIADILDMGPVMPVIVIDHAEDGVALADALLTGGLQTIEVTLRTPAAVAIKAIAGFPEYALAPGL